MIKNSIKIFSSISTTDGAGVKLKRIIGQPRLNMFDPFLLLDAFSSNNPNDYIAGFPSHPHRGFETVSYMLKGKMRHKDNAGHEGVIEAGGVQWMTAGKGIIHSEMPEQEKDSLDGFQLWINLPSTHKMSNPSYQEFSAQQIPIETRPGANIKVIAGITSQGNKGPVIQELTKPIYLDITLLKDTVFTESLPQGNNSFIYIINGDLTIQTNYKSVSLIKGQIALLSDSELIKINAITNSQFLLVSGKPINEPVARAGPFVMNTQKELKQAFRDYDMGLF